MIDAEPDAPVTMVSTERVTLDELYRRDFAAVVGLAFVLSGSRSAAEELAQEAFLAAHRRWSSVGAYDDPGAWVRRVVANRSVSVIRRRAVEVRALARLSGQRRPQPDALPEDSECFWRAVRSLPARQAQVVALHYLEDRSVEDIAGVLGCAPSTVKVHLYRARAALASTLSIEEEDR